MNKAESEQISSYFDLMGYRRVRDPHIADVIVLNTCVVRQNAENKVIGMLGYTEGIKKSKPGLTLLVTGCFVDPEVANLQKRFPYVDGFFRPGDITSLKEWVRERGWLTTATKLSEGLPPIKRGTVSALVPIIQGCNNFCAYCIVPYRRGREKSRPLAEIINHVKELAGSGTKEIVLLGQNVNSYGQDLPEKSDFAELLRQLNAIDGIERIRFLTNHPKDMSKPLIETIASLKKVCEYISLPLQSGDDGILAAMRRGYTSEQFKQLVNTIRNYIPEVAISTDVIVGFPGEDEKEFEHTVSMLRELRFDAVHVAAYSPRPGTLAASEYTDNVPPSVKRERLNKIEMLQASICGEINAELKGKKVEVLVEGRKGNKWFGRTRTNKLTFFESKDDCLGQLVHVTITKTSPWALQGELV